MLVFSLIIPILSSSSEVVVSSAGNVEITENQDDPLADSKLGLRGSVEQTKELNPADIWHSEVDYSEVGNPGKEPFETKETTVKISLTGRGHADEIVEPFDWVFSMDSSGSMGWNDPDGLRIDAAQHFVDLVEENVSSSRGATIDYDSSAHLVNNRSLTDDYDAIRSDLGTIGASGGTDFNPALNLSLEEFQENGNSSRRWYNLFLSDGEPNSPIDWSLIDEHADHDISIYTIGVFNVGEGGEEILKNMAEDTGGEYYYAEDPEDIEGAFENIFDDITSLCEKAVGSPEDEAMVREVLPPYLEYVEGSAVPEENFEWLVEGDNTYLEWDKEDGLDINETWEVEYKVRASKYGHDLPITAYDEYGNSLSRISYLNLSSGEVDRIYNPGSELKVHGPPKPVLGVYPQDEVEVGEPVIFKNTSGNEMSSWPGDCTISKYRWDFGDGESYSESEGEENFNGTADPHKYDSPGTYEVSLEATTVDGVYAVTESKSVTVTDPEEPSIVITRPQGSETWYAGDEEEITWETTKGDAPLTEIELEYSIDGGGSWDHIARGLEDTGSYSWTVPDISTDEARIRGVVHDENGLTAADMSGRFKITGVLSYVEIDPVEDQTITAGKTIDFDARAYDIEGGVLEDDDSEFIWNYADGTGLFDETKAGEYQVTATYEGVTSPVTTVTVVPTSPEKVMISPRQDQTIEAGEIIEFEAEVYDEYYNLIEEEDTAFTWKNTDRNGLFSETEAGHYQVTATYEGVSSPVTMVTVDPGDEDRVLIIPDEDQIIEAGETIDFEAELYDAYENLIEDDDTQFTWKNTDPTGLFSETEAGKYGISAAYENITSPSTPVVVEPSDAVEVIIYPDKDKTVAIGDSLLFNAEAYDTYDNLITDDSTEFIWKNASQGRFAEEDEGTYDVTASYNEIESSSVTVLVEEEIDDDTMFDHGYYSDHWWLILILVAIASIVISQIGLFLVGRKKRS